MTKNKSNRKYERYLVERPNGVWEKYSIPRVFTPMDVATAFHCSETWIFLPEDSVMFGMLTDHNYCGPCWVYIHQEHGPYAATVSEPNTLDSRTLNDLMRGGTKYVHGEETTCAEK